MKMRVLALCALVCTAQAVKEGLFEGSNRDLHRIIGPMAALFTPMTGKGGTAINLDGVEPMAKALAAWGVQNVMVAGTTGESVALSVAERKALTEKWVSIAPKYNQTVYVHIGNDAIGSARELAAHAQSVGASGILSMTPVYFKPATVEALAETMSYIAGGAPNLPFWYYNFPAHTGLDQSMYELLQINEATGLIPNLMGVKFTFENLMDFYECAEYKNGKYNMLIGRDEILFSALATAGAQAAVGSTFNYLDTNLQMFKVWDSNAPLETKRTQCMALQKKTDDVVELFSQYPGKNIQKAIVNMRNLPAGPTRLPQKDLSESEYGQLKQQLIAMGVLNQTQYIPSWQEVYGKWEL